jgi:hypothetical protein
MLSFENATLTTLALHRVGNKSIEEGIELANQTIPMEKDELKQLLLNYFLTAFSGNEMYSFYHEIELAQNEVFAIAQSLFEQQDVFLEASQNLAKYLYGCSAHPKIKAGDLYVAYFKNSLLDNKRTDAIGIFKSETKDNYLKVVFENNAPELLLEEGTNTNKLDKGCLIFNSKTEAGYPVCIIDNLNKASEAVYWKDAFLKVTPIKNEFHQTNQFLNIAKNYVTGQLQEDFEVSRTDQINLLNRSVEYFKSHENFNKEEFETEVFQDPGLISSFQKFEVEFKTQHAIELENQFEISASAVKKQARVFKSVLKLDKNFHIYIHGNSELIEQGMEKDGRKFYKIYFNEEY